MYELEFVRGHVEVYLDGAFCFSADTRGDADLSCWNFPYQSRYNGKRPAGITRRGVPRYREIQEVEKRNQLKK